MKKMMLLLAFLISIGTSAFGQLVKEVFNAHLRY